MRIIDADALREKVADHVTTVSVCPTVEHAHGRTAFKKICLEDIDNAPTVTDTGWVSVDNRLPTEDDYTPIYGNYDGAVLWYNGLEIGMGWYYNSTDEWADLDDHKPFPEVTHWRRLPEPPKENK